MIKHFKVDIKGLLMSFYFEIKGALYPPSHSENDIPTDACLIALQSLAPSPTIQTLSPYCSKN